MRFWFSAAGLIAIVLLLSLSAHCQGTSQIDVIQFQNSSGVPIKSFAAPFKIKCFTNVTCTASGSVLTISASGTGGSGGYATIQNGAVPIAQEAAINFLGSFSCVDNLGNASSDCKLSASAAVSHQFVTGVDSSGNYLRAAILAADVPTLNQSTTGNAATATALAANPTDCSANQYADAIDAGGNLTCAQVAYGQLASVPTTFAPTAHNLLSASHGDTTAGTVTRGDVITGQGASATWARLAKGTANQVLSMDGTGTDVLWATLSAGGGSGTVTNIATTAPIGGGPITATGTLTCTSCVVATTPGVGIAHFAGATQTVTSSAVTSADTTGTFPATAHALLSATHSDTTAAAPVRGDGLFAIGATPTWQRLAHPATTGGYYKWNGTDIVASTGAAAGTGACTNQFVSTENADAAPTCTSIARVTESADARGWAFCGTATAATTTVGPVSAATCCSGGTCQQFMVMYIIVGYNGGTPIGRLLTGPGAPSTTGRTNADVESENVTAPSSQINTLALPGLPLAVTASAIGRSGTCFIDGASGSLKTYRCEGTEGTPAIATAPTLFRAASFFSDLSTNLPLQQFQLSVYDGLTQVAVSAQTFLAGTYLAVWGRKTD